MISTTLTGSVINLVLQRSMSCLNRELYLALGCRQLTDWEE
jgi:hypothetical protein